MDDYISREALIEHLNRFAPEKYDALVNDLIRREPAADVRPVVKAKWEDVHIDRPEIADIVVASMFCPNCNRWHNEVYHYGNPIEFANFCKFCGADMREARNK